MVPSPESRLAVPGPSVQDLTEPVQTREPHVGFPFPSALLEPCWVKHYRNQNPLCPMGAALSGAERGG